MPYGMSNVTRWICCEKTMPLQAASSVSSDLGTVVQSPSSTTRLLSGPHELGQSSQVWLTMHLKSTASNRHLKCNLSVGA